MRSTSEKSGNVMGECTIQTDTMVVPLTPNPGVWFVYYESLKRELNKRLIFDIRCDARL